MGSDAVKTRTDLLRLHVDICSEACGLMERKNKDYGDFHAPFGNLDIIEVLYRGKFTTEHGIVIRLGDKVCRLATAVQRPLVVDDETVRDTCIDIINYAILLLAKQTTRETE